MRLEHVQRTRPRDAACVLALGPERAQVGVLPRPLVLDAAHPVLVGHAACLCRRAEQAHAPQHELPGAVDGEAERVPRNVRREQLQGLGARAGRAVVAAHGAAENEVLGVPEPALVARGVLRVEVADGEAQRAGKRAVAPDALRRRVWRPVAQLGHAGAQRAALAGVDLVRMRRACASVFISV